MSRDRVTAYAQAVCAGEVDGVGELHRLACERHLRDLSRADVTWDAAAASRVLDYAGRLVVAEGFEPRPLRLLDCQAFDVGCTFGWKNQDGHRRFRRRYKSLARQQGKTMENGLMATYIAAFSGYRLGKLFTVATKKRQARLAWEEAAKFVRADPDLAEWFSVKDYKSLITAKNTGCTIEALSKEGGLDDGFRSVFASVDEIHQHRDNRIYKAIYDGTRALPETLVSMITTRGFDLNSFCHDMDSYAVNVLRGSVTADDMFCDIYAPDEGDDPMEEASWRKANPWTFANPRMVEQMRRDAQTARDMGGAELRDFLTKSVNVWVENAEDTFIPPGDWQGCASPLTLEDFRGAQAWVGLDLSHGGDLTTMALEFDAPGGGVWAWSHSYMPRGRLMEHVQTDLAPYDEWEREGLLTVTGGAGDFKNDYGFIIAELRALVEGYGLRVQSIGIDPHNADGVLGELEAFGAPVALVTQSCRSLHDATTDVQLLARSGRYLHDPKNELMTWSFMNARLVRNSFDEVKVDKRAGAQTKRVDAVDAAIDAHFVRMGSREDAAVDVSGGIEEWLRLMGAPDVRGGEGDGQEEEGQGAG